ncbi:coiled-coil domain-containing protein 86 isoform X1 [Chanos chanos]|uniref:Coiled-coil domain-containing protein 86 n=2 Tax=Chanos chanos TaxID=29144 RepID=A0A6J2WHP3_CHACN|nr:coiled-coil domain-containing protein 86 isoform X1 [Chanos chanos]
MSTCQPNGHDGQNAQENESSGHANEEDTGVELPPPIVTRTRSGRRVRTPAALLDSEMPTLRTPSRRTRKSVIQEVPSENAQSTLEAQHEAADTHAVIECPLKADSPSPIEDPCPNPEVSVCTVISKSATTANSQSLISSVTDTETRLISDEVSEKENQGNTTEKSVSVVSAKQARKRTHSESCDKKDQMVPLGKPKSGRIWKDRNKQRFSALLRDKPLRTSWEKKMEVRREKELLKKYQQKLNEEKAREKEEKKRRRAENIKRRAENERKAEIVQVIRNTAKIKRIKKKQLRKIEKRDTLPMLQKSAPVNRTASGKAGKGE